MMEKSGIWEALSWEGILKRCYYPMHMMSFLNESRVNLSNSIHLEEQKGNLNKQTNKQTFNFFNDILQKQKQT